MKTCKLLKIYLKIIVKEKEKICEMANFPYNDERRVIRNAEIPFATETRAPFVGRHLIACMKATFARHGVATPFLIVALRYMPAASVVVVMTVAKVAVA